MSSEENMNLMQTLDDAWNSQDWATYEARHSPDCVIHWTGRPEATRGRHDHRAESEAIFATFPDNKIANRPYKTFFASGDWTCSIAEFTGTMTGPLDGPNGEKIPPTGKSFTVDFCTVAKWKNGEIVEENLFYDVGSMMQQIGLA